MTVFGFLEMPGGGEMLLIVFFIVIFFGAKKIPELMRGLGRGIREFKDASKGIQKEIQEGIDAANEEPKRLIKN
jgi:sec-independent protein translocase protein TatA